MTSFEGDTGPYLQYSHARLCSILKKSASSKEEIDSADLSHLTEQHGINVVRLLIQYPDTVVQALKNYEPTTILQYLFRLTHVLNSSYDVLRVIGSPPEVRKARLALFDSTRAVLNHGMKILGLRPLER
jgi:arginyl-tRNA synthetase